MKNLLWAALILLLSFRLEAEQLPEDIAAGIRLSSRGESGGLFVNGVGDERFIGYITANWRWLLDHQELIPPHEGNYGVPDGNRIDSLRTIGVACEWLPPVEYVEFLNRWLDLYEAGQINFDLLKFQLYGMAEKSDFISYNFDDSRIRKLLKRAIALTPAKEVQAKGNFEEMLDGTLSASWMVNRSEKEPPPELLPWSIPPFPFKHEIKRLAFWIFLGFAVRCAWKTWRKRKQKEESPRLRLYPPGQT